MPVVFSSSFQIGTPQAMKKRLEPASNQRKKLGNQTMPAGSQSPNSTWIGRVWVRLMDCNGLVWVIGLAARLKLPPWAVVCTIG